MFLRFNVAWGCVKYLSPTNLSACWNIWMPLIIHNCRLLTDIIHLPKIAFEIMDTAISVGIEFESTKVKIGLLSRKYY